MLHMIDTTDCTKDVNWCGPAALSALTGQPLKASNEQLCQIRGEAYDELDGVHNEELIIALNNLNYQATQLDIVGRYPDLTHGPTLLRFMGDRTPYERSQPMLIVVSGHFITAHWDYLVDNWVMKVTPLPNFPKVHRLVKAAYTIKHRG